MEVKFRFLEFTGTPYNLNLIEKSINTFEQVDHGLFRVHVEYSDDQDREALLFEGDIIVTKDGLVIGVYTRDRAELIFGNLTHELESI